MTTVPDRETAERLHPAGKGRVVAIDAPGVDEVGVVPWNLLLRRRAKIANRWAVLVVVLAGLFTVSITITILVVSLGTIADDLDSSEQVLAWSITGPMLAFGVVGPAYGKAGDVWGQKRLFVFGLVGAGVFAGLTALAWSAASMIAFRTLSATAGAAIGPASMAIISRQFDGEERVRALGFWSLVAAGAPVIGVVVGGPAVDAFGWRVIFAVQMLLCTVALVVGVVLLPETERGEQVRFDVAGAVLLASGATAFLMAVNRGPAWEWADPRVLALFAATPVLLAAFVAVERRAAEPLLPLSWLRRRNVVAPIASQTFTNFAYMGAFIITPLLLADGLGLTTAQVGLLIISRPLAFAVTAPLGSRVTVRAGERWSGTVGAGVVTLSMLGLAAIGDGTAGWFISASLAASGVGLGLASPALTATVAGAVDESDLGAAAALQQLSTQVGAVVGAQVMQTVQTATEGARGVIGSFGVAYYVGAAAAVVGMLAATRVRSSSGHAPVVRS